MSIVSKILKDRLEESVFSSNPAKRRQSFSRLGHLLHAPLPAKHAVAKIKKHADDPRLMQDLAHFEKHAPEIDVRPILKKRIKELQKAHG